MDHHGHRAAPFALAHQRRLLLWLPLVGIALAVLLTQGDRVGGWLADWTGAPYPIALPAGTVLAVFTTGLLCEFMDTGLGMGFGIVAAPLLLILGFEPLDIFPAILLCELLTGATAGLLHQHDGNIDLIGDRRARRTLILLAALSAAGALAAVLLGIQPDNRWFAFGSGAVLLALGVPIFVGGRVPLRLRGGGILAGGFIAALIKGLGGGSYGSMATSGQVVCGVPARQAIATAAIAEAVTCLVLSLGYLAAKGAPDWSLALPLIAGAMLAVPWATLITHGLPQTWLRPLVGGLTLALGLATLVTLLADTPGH